MLLPKRLSILTNPFPENTPTGADEIRKTLIVAAWFGLFGGLVEGFGLLVLQELEWLSWMMEQQGVSIEIIWISPAFGFLLYAVAGLLLVLIWRVVSYLRTIPLAVLSALLLGFFSWLKWTGRIRIELFLFLVLGVFLLVVRRLLPKLSLPHLALFFFGMLTFFDWLTLSGRIQDFGAFWMAAGLSTVLVRRLTKHDAVVFRFLGRSLPWVFVGVVLALFGIQGTQWLKELIGLQRLPIPSPESPNVLVIVVDTMRSDHVSIAGYSRQTTPNIDRIAQRGVLLESAFATSSWTLPSHASFLTGRFPHEHRAETEEMSDRLPTIAEAFRDRGYRTAAFSANTFFFTRQMGFGRGFLRFEDYFTSVSDMAARTLYGRKFAFYVLRALGHYDLPARKLAPDVNRSALQWIGKEPGRPFFVFLNYFDAHDPYLPPLPYRTRFSKLMNPGGLINSYVLNLNPEMTPEQFQGEIDAYDGAIAYVDEHIGLLLGELERRGLMANTILVITSDHGESFGEHGLLLHRNALYREVLQVPMVFYWPGHLPENLRLDCAVSIASLPATLMDLVGAENKALFPGPSLVPLWKNSAACADWPDALAEMAQFPFELVKNNPSYSGSLKSLVGTRWHYIKHQTLGPELFEWAKDPEEKVNLIGTPVGQNLEGEFARRLQSRLGSSRAGNGHKKQAVVQETLGPRPGEQGHTR
jgi:arylsulfatase A-like enzyme